MECFTYGSISANMYYLQCFGAFGKIAINCFVLITGYFMVTARWTWKKWLKLYLEVKFYTLLIYAVFVLSGRYAFNYHECLETVFSTVFGIGKTYADTFLALYLLIPFFNTLIEHLEKKQHKRLLGVLCVILSLIPTFSIFMSVLHSYNETWNYLFWMIFLYLLGAYIRKYDEDISKKLSARFDLLLLLLNLALIFGWIALYDAWASKHDIATAYWFVNDANKLLALTCAVAIFMVFKNIRIKNSRFINTVAATTFGVFLIHTSGDYMRSFLWRDIFKCAENYNSPHLVIYTVFAVISVFAVCSMIDFIRITFLEKPLFSMIDKKCNSPQEAKNV